MMSRRAALLQLLPYDTLGQMQSVFGKYDLPDRADLVKDLNA